MSATTRARWIVAAIVVVGLAIVGTLSNGTDSDQSSAPATVVPSTQVTPTTSLPDDAPSAPPSTAPTTLSTTPSTTATVPPTTPVATTIPPTTATPAKAASAKAGPVATVRWILGGVAVKGRAPKTGYERSQFGPAWSDNVDVAGGHNGCDTRNDILRRDLTNITVRPGTRDCIITTGVLIDPYTGVRIDFTRGQRTSSAVQIDHVVALSDAWQKGAQQLDEQRRRDLANDPMNLLAVDGPTNARKSDSDAASWLPPNKGFRCRYVALQTYVKARYHLWMTQAEHDMISRILQGCTDAAVGHIA